MGSHYFTLHGFGHYFFRVSQCTAPVLWSAGCSQRAWCELIRIGNVRTWTVGIAQHNWMIILRECIMWFLWLHSCCVFAIVRLLGVVLFNLLPKRLVRSNNVSLDPLPHVQPIRKCTNEEAVSAAADSSLILVGTNVLFVLKFSHVLQRSLCCCSCCRRPAAASKPGAFRALFSTISPKQTAPRLVLKRTETN